MTQIANHANNNTKKNSKGRWRIGSGKKRRKRERSKRRRI
jgi:hypothetical protein